MPAVRSERDSRLNVLMTEGEQSWVQQLPRLLQPQGVRAIIATDVDEAVRVIRQGPVHAVVVDMAVPMARLDDADDRALASEQAQGGTGGLKLLRVIRRLEPAPPTVVVRGRRFDRRHDDRLLSEALRLQAFSVLDQPVQLEQLLEVLRRLIERHYGGRWPGTNDPDEHR
ncbi:MAG: hypothetical protein WD294_07930 [Phycisphaeraceae bacterium]